jgi:hypothetical protein
MTDAVKMKAPAHYLRVDLDDPGEAEYWQVVLDASRCELESAIAAVGRDALDVKAWLSGHCVGPASSTASSPRKRGSMLPFGEDQDGSPLSRG